MREQHNGDRRFKYMAEIKKGMPWWKWGVVFLVLVLLLAACAPGAPSEANVEEGSYAEEPAAEGADQPPIQVVYGEDGRLDVCSNCSSSEGLDDPNLQEIASSIAILVRPEALIVSGEDVQLNAYSLSEKIEITKGAPMCEGQRFSDQPAPGFCTGFLVGDQILLTAGHCVPDQAACEHTAFVFSFQVDENNEVRPIEATQVFGCDQVLDFKIDPEDHVDYAIIRLDRPTGLPYVSVPQVDNLDLGSGLAVIGHPNGLPQKLAAFGQVLENDPPAPYFIASLDTFGGNSGSPVILSENDRVVGMLISGEQDYELTADGCYAVKVCQQDGSNCSGEAVMRIDFLADILDAFASP